MTANGDALAEAGKLSCASKEDAAAADADLIVDEGVVDEVDKGADEEVGEDLNNEAEEAF